MNNPLKALQDYGQSVWLGDFRGGLDAGTLYERLAVEDLRMVADTLRPVYEAADKRDGFINVGAGVAIFEAGVVEAPS